MATTINVTSSGEAIGLGNASGDYQINLDGFTSVTITGGNGSDIVVVDGGGSVSALTLGNGADSVTVTGGATVSAITLGNGSDAVTVVDGGTVDDLAMGNGTDTVIVGAGAGPVNNMTLGNGNDTVSAGSNETIKLGNGNDVVTGGADDQVVAGHGTDTFTLGDGSTVSAGNRNDTITLVPLPVTSSTVVTSVENGAYTFKASDFPFFDANGTSFADIVITSLSQPSGSILTLNGSAVPLDTPISVAELSSGDLVFTPAADSAGSGYATFNFEVQDNGSPSETSSLATVTINIIQAPPVLGGATSATVSEGATVALGATDAPAFADDTLGDVTIAGLPGDLSGFNGGSYTVMSDTGTWTGSAAQFNSLSFTAGQTAGTFNLSIAATTAGSDSGAPATEAYELTINPPPQPQYTFTTVDDPSQELPFGTIVNGINNSGQMVGVFNNGLDNGLLDSNGTLSTLDDPGGTGTVLVGINDGGTTVGYFIDSNFQQHGLIYNNGTWTTLDDPSTTVGYTVAQGINDSGEIVGSYAGGPNGSIFYGFLYSNGTYTTLADPSATGGTVGNPLTGAGSNGTDVTGINNLGQIVGSFDNATGTHGFLYSDGTWTTLDDPAATGGTFATGINDFGQVVGYYFDATGSHGFLFNGNTYITLDDPLATGGPDLGPGNTFAYGINDYGQVVGKYFAADGEHGFLADPAQVTVNPGATYEISGASANAVTFAGNTGTLQLDQSQSFAGTLSNFGGQDQIDLRDIAFSPSTTLGYTADGVNTGGTMTVSDGIHTANIALFGQYTAGSFAMVSDGHGGTLITDPAPAPQNQLAPQHPAN